MTKDEIIRLAEQAGFKVFGDRVVAADWNCSGMATESVMRFAELVAAAEREACAKACEQQVNLAAPAFKRESIAHSTQCAEAIRARSNKGE